MNVQLIVFIFGCLALTTACSKQDETSSRQLLDVSLAAPYDRVGVFVWTEPDSKENTRLYFGAERFEEDLSYEQILSVVEPFGYADFSQSVVRYGWAPVRSFTVCADQSDILHIATPEVFSEIINSTSFGIGGNCDGEGFTSYLPNI